MKRREEELLEVERAARAFADATGGYGYDPYVFAAGEEYKALLRALKYPDAESSGETDESRDHPLTCRRCGEEGFSWMRDDHASPALNQMTLRLTLRCRACGFDVWVE